MSKGYIEFWGVRGSNPTPDKDKMEFGGDTSCVEIKSNDNDVIILDMGSGIRNLGNKILSDSSYPKTINILLSHFHWDHIMGFLYFAPFFDSSYTFNIYGYNKHTSTNLFSKKILDSTFWPVSMDMLNAKINFLDLDGKPLHINNKIHVDYANHAHPNSATSFRVSIDGYSIVYTTDCEHPVNSLNENVVSLAENANILIHDSHFKHSLLEDYKGWGHSSWKEAIDVSKKANVKTLCLFHYNPAYDDDTIKAIEQKAKQHFPDVIASKQGLKIDF